MPRSTSTTKHIFKPSQTRSGLHTFVVETTFLWSLNHHLWSEIIFLIVSAVWAHRYFAAKHRTSRKILQISTSDTGRYLLHSLSSNPLQRQRQPVLDPDRIQGLLPLMCLLPACQLCVSFIVTQQNTSSDLPLALRWHLQIKHTVSYIWKKGQTQTACAQISKCHRVFSSIAHTLRKTHIFLCDETDRKVT